MRLFNFTTVCCGILFCAILVAWFVTGDVKPEKQHLSLSRDCHVSISEFLGGRRLSFFSYARWGPSLEGIWAVSGKDDPPNETAVYLGGAAGYIRDPSIRINWFDAPGIYFRLRQPTNGQSMWSLSVSLWYPLISSGVLPGVWMARRMGRNRRARGFAVIHVA